MNNLHISLTEFRNESRVLKQTNSIATLPGIQHVYIAALHNDNLKTDETLGDNITLKRFVLTTRGLSKGLFAQLIKYVELLFRIILFYRKKGVGIINVHTLALLPLGYIVKLLYGAKLIYDTHELETETVNSRGIRKKLAKLVERLLIRKADHIFVVSENIANWYQKEYEIPRPTIVLNAPNKITIEKNQYFRNHFQLRDDQIIALYQGGLSPGRGIEILLEAFSLRGDDRIIIVFMGYGILEDQIKNVADKYKTVFFHQAVPPGKLLSHTVSADIGISLIENTCLSYYYCMPNKLFEYTMVGLPVLVSNMKEMREFVERYEIGWVMQEQTIESVNQTIDMILKTDMTQYKNNTYLAASENCWEHQEKKMLAVYNILLG